MNKRQLFSSKVPKKRSKQGPEIDLKSIKTQAWTPRSPFLCSKVPLDRPKVPQDAKVRQQACQMTGLGTKNNNIRLPKCQESKALER